MKKLLSIAMLAVLLVALTACGKEVKGDYSSFDDNMGQVDLHIGEKNAKLDFVTKKKVAKKASEGFFSPKIDTTNMTLKGTVDEKEKLIRFKSEDGVKFKAKYVLKGDMLEVTLDTASGKMKFYKKDTDEYKKKYDAFDEKQFFE